MNRLTPKLPVPKKVKIRKAWRIATKSFWILVVLVLIIQLFRLNLFLEKASNTNLDQASAQVEQLQTQIDELREYLLLPTTSTEEELQNRSEQSLEQFLADLLVTYEREKTQSQRQTSFLRALDRSYLNLSRAILNTDYQIVEATEFLEQNSATTSSQTTSQNPVNNSPQNTSTTTQPTTNTLEQSSTNQYFLVNENEPEQEIFSFGFDGTRLFFNSELENKTYLSNQLTEFNAKLEFFESAENREQYLKMIENATQAKEELTAFSASPPIELAALLSSKNLTLSYDQNSPFELTALKSDQTVAFKIIYNPPNQSFSLLDERNRSISANTEDLESLLPSLETYLRLNTFQTLVQKNLQEKLVQIQTILQTPSFLNKIEELNLEVAVQETDEFYQVQFLHQPTKEVVFQIDLDKTTAEVYTTRPNQDPVRISFLSPIQESSQNQRTFLIAGKQGSLTDSLILAYINESSRKISLLSIPRDLYLDGRKINSIYARQGMPALVSTIENLIGREIENHVLIDMFAFIDIVDYLGGVEVYLANAISDPTYRTFDNGVWSTMHFSAGQHKLNGTQALRLARSRYTSSDFARAERQQMLITALRDQINSLTFRDFRTFTSIAFTLQSKTDTDIPLNKAITYFFRYKDFEISDQNVLSTQNILVSTYSNEYNQINCENCGRGAYILIPKNEDWSLLQTYVNTIFSS